MDPDARTLLGAERLEHAVVQVDERPRKPPGRIELDGEPPLREVDLHAVGTRVQTAPDVQAIALSMVPDLTAAAGAPRVAAIEFPFGRPLGQPGDAGTQRAVLRATLEVLRAAPAPGTVTQLPFVWPETHDQVHWHPKEPSPISRLLAGDPSVFKRLVPGEIPAAASRRNPD